MTSGCKINSKGFQRIDPVLAINKKDFVLTVTLNRPEVLNAINFEMLWALKNQFEACRSDPDIRVVIITGTGNRAFCSGADLKERFRQSEKEIRAYNLAMNKFAFIENLNKPVIAAVNGIAYGGGTEIALASDIRIASSNASLGLIETRRATIPGAGGTQRLPRLIGMGKAKELIFTGRYIEAKEALEIGLIDKIFPQEKLLDEAFNMASLIARNGPIAVEQAKYAINRGFGVDLHTGFDIETEAYGITISTQDRLEGLHAFLDKREPIYRGA
jgi:enoyl-CoA hydratase/carnithine racemase